MLAMDNKHEENITGERTDAHQPAGAGHIIHAPAEIQSKKAAAVAEQSNETAPPQVAAEPHQDGHEHAPATAVLNTQSAEIESLPTGGVKMVTPLVKKQLEHCATIIKGMKRHASSPAFHMPVDPVALGIPDYPMVIKHPMDLSTIQTKMETGVYESAEQFKEDVKLMFENCYTYNKPDTQVYVQAKQLEKYFDGHFAKLPTELAAPPAVTDDFGGKKRKTEGAAASRPRRESATPHRASSVIPAPPSSRAKRNSPELTFCMAVWKELTKKSNAHLAWPFMEPVDPVKLGIPDYHSVIKEPMDLSTLKKKLDAGQYSNADEFEADVRLVFKNCYLYNGVESDVARIGRDLEAVFDRKWAAKPIPGASVAGSPAAYDDFDADSEKIIQLNQQIQVLQAELNDLLMKRTTAKRSGPKSFTAPKPKLPRPEPLAMTFEQKRQLSMDVNGLSPEKLGRVVEIIHDSMPNLHQQSDSDVIELDIESLDSNTLRQLQAYVNECKKGTKKKAKKPADARVKKQQAAPAPGMVTPMLEESISTDDSSSSDDD